MNSSHKHSDIARVELNRLALSNRAGEAQFELGDGWDENRGMGRVSEDSVAETKGAIAVKLAKLDDVLTPKVQVGVCKIDVEGHELKVFEGSQSLLKERRIRDIIFEDWGKERGAVHAFLQGYGFTVFALHFSLLRPRLGDTEPRIEIEANDAPNYLATLNPARVRARFAQLGWRVLGSFAK